MASSLLSRYEIVHTANAHEMRAAVSRAFCAHELVPVGGHGIDARLRSARAGHIGLHYLDYGAEVRISPARMSTFYLVEIPLAGRAEIHAGGERLVSGPAVAFVPSLDDDLTLHWADQSPKLVVQIDRTSLEKLLCQMLDRSLKEPLRFDLAMDLADPALRAWRRVVDMIVYEMDTVAPFGAPLAMADAERLMLSRLLLAQPNNYTSLLHREAPGTAPRTIRRAADLIEAHAAEPLCVDDIAEAVGLSARALQQGFRSHLGTTPMRHLRDVRLRRAHEDLMAADSASATVTEVALRWGFVHASRFSMHYRERFGESPSVTLRR